MGKNILETVDDMNNNYRGREGRLGGLMRKPRRWFHVLVERLPEKGLTRTDLVKRIAAKASVAESTVYSWLNGNREVSPEELKLIATEASFMVGELLEEDAYYLRDAQERALIDQFRDMAEGERTMLLKLILRPKQPTEKVN